jgi:hypothetical protein
MLTNPFKINPDIGYFMFIYINTTYIMRFSIFYVLFFLSFWATFFFTDPNYRSIWTTYLPFPPQLCRISDNSLSMFFTVTSSSLKLFPHCPIKPNMHDIPRHSAKQPNYTFRPWHASNCEREGRMGFSSNSVSSATKFWEHQFGIFLICSFHFWFFVCGWISIFIVIVLIVLALYSLCVSCPLLFVKFCLLCFVWAWWCVLFVCCGLL